MGAGEDVADLLRYLEENRGFLAPFEASKPPGYDTAPFWEEQFRRSLQEFYVDLSLRLFLFKRLKGDEKGPIIGSINFTQFVRGPFQACQLGYGMDEREQGKGLMTEALQALIPYVFGELGFHRIMASYMPENRRSARVLERLGFVVEGQAKDYVLIEGQWRDHVLTSLVNPRWVGTA